MEFYFCETCGTRITDKEIEQGMGRDKKLKGVYCNKCSVGVMTMEFAAIAPDPHSKKASAPAIAATPQSAIEPYKRSGTKLSAARESKAVARGDRKTMPTPVIVGGIVAMAAITILVVFVSSSKSGNTSTQRDAEHKTIPSAAPKDLPPLPGESRPERPVDLQQKPDLTPVLTQPVPPQHAELNAVSPVTTAVAQPSSSDKVDAGDWQELFDGKTMTGWQESFGKWGVVDGALTSVTLARNGARVETAGSFDNFELTCEVQGPAQCAAVQLRDTGITFVLNLQKNVWSSLSVKAMGESVQCCLSGSPLPKSADKADNNGGLHGRIAFYANNTAVLKVRNIKLRRLSIQKSEK